MKELEIEEDDLLLKLHLEASKNGGNVVAIRPSEVDDFSSQYGSEQSISYTADCIVGHPSIYPKAGDHARIFEPKTYGKWWLSLPSSRKSKINLPNGIAVESQDFLEFRITSRIEPLLIRIYEVYNPCAVVKILCYCYGREKWVTLWKGPPQYLPPKRSNCFTAKFKKVNFFSDFFRIEFHHKHLKYFYGLDSLILYGENRFPVCFPTYTLPRVIPSSFQRKINLPVNENANTIPHTSLLNSEVPTFDDGSKFNALPNEVIFLIFSHLDLESLCTAAKVSRLFKKTCYDQILYKDLNLQLYWHLVDVNALRGLESRLQSLKTLNLSWCGGQGRITPYYFVDFVELRCQQLTSLKLSNCSFVNNSCLKAIAFSCPLLQELELRSCRSRDLTPVGFKYISELKKLNYLDLYRTYIDDSALISIIKSTPLEHLFMGSCRKIDSWNDVARAIANNLRLIKTLDFWRATSLNCNAVRELAENCNELVELDLSWCNCIIANCGCIRLLITRCTKLKKLFLGAIRTLSADDMHAISSYSHNLEQLDLLGAQGVPLAAIKEVLQSCKKIKTIGCLVQ